MRVKTGTLIALFPLILLGCKSEPSTHGSQSTNNRPWKTAPIHDPQYEGEIGPFMAFSGLKSTGEDRKQVELNIPPLGMERWEDGKLVTDTWERWELKYADPSFNPLAAKLGPDCHLEVLTIRNFSDNNYIDLRDFSTFEKTLKITRFDFKEGLLDFEFGDLLDDNPIKCQVIFERTSNGLQLRSFRGGAIKKSMLSGKMFTVEYRPAAQSSTLNIPLQWPGMKSR